MSIGSGILRDVRFAAHALRRSPGFSLIAIVTLALGIGANTSMFSILNSYILEPAPYPDREHVDRIYRATAQDATGGISPADYLLLKPEAHAYGEIAAYGTQAMSLAQPGQPAEMAVGVRTSANLFAVLGAQPLLGRTFRPEEETHGNHRVLVLSHRYWENRFGGDPAVVGRAVRVDGEVHEIVGVLPADFSDWRHLKYADLYRPLGLDEKEALDRSSTWLRLVGRRPAGRSHAEGESFVASFGGRLASDFPSANAGSTWRLVPIDESFLSSRAQVMIGMLIGLSGFVLLIACSNLANLLLARTMARAREFAVRAALGASRLQALRPLLMEALLLALAGGALALLVAQWTYDWFAVVSRGDSGVGVHFSIDWRVVGWAFGACVFTALAFGVVPALFVHRLDLNSTLKSGGRGVTTGRGHHRFRQVLIAGQFTLAMVLLAGAAFFVHGLDEVNNRREGWESTDLVTGTLVLPSGKYPGDADVAALQERALERVEALPGVRSASFSYAMPFFGLGERRKYVVDGRDLPQPGQEPAAAINGVSPRYFETVGTRTLGGRVFTEADTATSPKVYVVNEAMARGLFAGEDPIGRRIAQAGGATLEWGTIVGVVADVDSVFFERLATRYQVYQPLAQEPRRATEIAVRTAGVAPAGLVESVRAAMMALDPDLPVRKLQPAQKAIERANYQDGVLGSVLSALALLGLGLASLGVYGVIARTVAQRRPEFGIRLALGARGRDITRLVLGSGAKVALVGSALGLVGAIALGRFFESAFPGIRTNTGPVLAGVTLLLVAIAQVAGYLPARKAARVDPTETLRAE